MPDVRVEPRPTAPQPAAPAGLVFLALLAALAGSAGSLALSLMLELKACPLCYYQRTFIFAAAGVLLVGVMTGAWRQANLAALALMPAAGGLTVALWHVYLEMGGRLECPAGLLGTGTAPQQSLAIHLLLVVLLVLGVVRGYGGPVTRLLGLVVALALGAAAGYGGIRSAAPPPPPSAADYEKAPDTCRKPGAPQP